MKCPYCHKTVRGDMPPHLEKNEKCLQKHRENLTRQTAQLFLAASGVKVKKRPT